MVMVRAIAGIKFLNLCDIVKSLLHFTVPRDTTPGETEGGKGSIRFASGRSSPVRLLLTPAGVRRGLLLDLGLGLVGSRLLFRESLLRSFVRRRRRNVPRHRAGVGGFRQAAGALFLSQLSHPAGELREEMIVHFLQIIQ